jgi:nucleotide-binding universal stress UspA family protein
MHLLIAYDGSSCAREMLTDLHRAGLPADCTALILGVVDAWAPPESPHADQALPGLAHIRGEIREAVAAQQKVVDDAAELLRARFPTWTVHTQAIADSPAWAIIKRAEGAEGGIAHARADLVVVGSHGHGGFKRLVLGSVSSKVVTHVHCSTRISRLPPTAPSHPPRLVVGVDGSIFAQAAIDMIASRQWPVHTEVCVVTVHESPLVFDAVGGIAPTIADMGWTRPIAERAAEQLRAKRLKVRVVCTAGLARQALLAEAAERDADCIFVGARGVRAVERFVLGSVSTSIAMNAPCSVEVVHPPPG